MKRIPTFLLTACSLFPLASTLLLVPAPAARAASATSGGQVDVNFFYDQLKDQGAWFNTTEYGDVWQPYIAYKNDSWRPYTDGYWTYTDGGWMFVSYESFGWAVYHYGRWTHLKDVGWAWVPGTEWAPAWVTWRSSDPNGPATPPGTATVAATSTDAPAAPPVNNPPPAGNGGGGPGPGPDGGYIGWAPLPPEAVYNDGYDFGPTVDVDFGIDPYDYSFVGIGDFGAPWIGGVLFGADRGYYCCEHSENITHLYYNRNGAYRGVYAGGPNYDRLRGRTAQPIAQLRIDRRTTRAAGPLDRVDGRAASVFAPRFSRNGVAPNGRVQFNRQPALVHADVLPGGQRGGGPNAQAQNSARAAFARQGQELHQRNPQNAAGGARNGTALATPEGVRSAPEGAGEPRTATATPQKAVRSTSRSGSGRTRGSSGSRSSGGRRTQSSHSGGGGHRSGGGGHGSGGGHSGGGHSGGGHSGGGHGGGGGKKH